jgi:hypothetical protein
MGLPGMHRTRHRASLLHESPRRPAHKRIQKELLTEESTSGAQHHILGHRYFLAIDRGHDVSTPEAAASWYDLVYEPLIDLVCSQDLDGRLPGWTETDIYVALTRIWLDLDEEGLAAGPEGAASTLLADPEAAGPPPRAPRRRLPRTRRPWGVRLNGGWQIFRRASLSGSA